MPAGYTPLKVRIGHEVLGADYAERHRLFGQIVAEAGLADGAGIREALDYGRAHGLPLGKALVALERVDEPALVAALNRRYGWRLRTLDDDVAGRLEALRGGERRGLRIPIKVKLSVAVIFIIWATILSLSVFVLSRQREQLLRETIKQGRISVNYIAGNARVPLLAEDVLRLNTLVREATGVEGVLYALVADNEGTILAHSDPSRIRQAVAVPPPQEAPRRDGAVVYYAYEDPRLGRVLNMTRPVAFQGRALGRTHVGLSLDFIEEQINRETVLILLLSGLIVVLGVAIAVLMGVGFARPIGELVAATREIGRGNLKHRIARIRNDELGDLARAVNTMSDELWRKRLMQESFGKYVGDEVVELILAEPENAWLRGVQGEAAILFTDVRGFTAFSERHSPAAVVEALNAYFTIATRHIQAHGGYVDKFIGDAVMGVFGVPVPGENPAEAAVRAALEMQGELGEAARATGNELLGRIGIGINVGPVVSGNIGSPDKMEYTVIGDSVNVASRLNGLAGDGEVVISESVFRAVGRLVRVERRAPQTVKGKSRPVRTYLVLGLRQARERREGRRVRSRAG